MQEFREQRAFLRLPYDNYIKLSVLFTESENLKKLTIEGRIIDTSQAGIGIVTDYPLEPGHVLQWDDKHQRGKLHLAAVRWAQDIGDCYRVGALFI